MVRIPAQVKSTENLRRRLEGLEQRRAFGSVQLV